MGDQDRFFVSNKICVVNDEDDVLLLQNPSGSWELPGGHLDHDEQPVEGLKREVREETSSALDDADLIFSLCADDVVTLFWRGTITSLVDSSDEHRDTDWVDVEGLDDYDVKHGDALRDVIRRVLEAS